MTELERRALLGDRQAQEECAKKGVMLTCPLCKGKAEEGKQVDVDEYYWWPTICCGNCNLHIVGSELFGEVTEEMRLKWNTRPAPPVGRCRDCAHWYKGHCVSPGLCAAEETDAEFYCQNFEPKEGEPERRINMRIPKMCKECKCSKCVAAWCQHWPECRANKETCEIIGPVKDCKDYKAESEQNANQKD